MKIPLCIPYIEEEEIEEVAKVLRSGWLAHGPKNEEFESAFAKYIGVKHAVSLNSCTSALHLAVQANDITGEVILPSFTFVASANAIITGGAKPVFVDIEEATCNVDPKKIKEAITDDTQAIMPVHYAGQSCDMKEIMRIAKEHDLKVIEDSAETVGGTFEGKKAGSFGYGCFSFYPTKNITTGEGGMLTSNDKEFIEKAKALHAHGISSSAFEREKKEKPWLRAAIFAGYNFRLCDVLATIGVVQLKKVDKMNEMRRKHAYYLTKQLKDFKGIQTPFEDKRCNHVFQMYTIQLEPKIDRTKFITRLREKGIGASVHFDPPVHEHPFYQEKYGEIKLPITEKVSKCIVSLPMFPQLKKEELDYMAGSISKSLKEAK